MRRAITLILLAVSPFGLAACGDDEEAAPATEESAATETPEATPAATATTSGEASTEGADTIVVAKLDEWSVKPKPASVKAGSIGFEAENVGAVVHELGVVKTDTAADAFPVADGIADVEAVGEEIGEVEDVAGGATKEFAVDLDAGNYVLICNLPAHYEQGMTIAFEVKG